MARLVREIGYEIKLDVNAKQSNEAKGLHAVCYSNVDWTYFVSILYPIKFSSRFHLTHSNDSSFMLICVDAIKIVVLVQIFSANFLNE